LKLKLMEQSNSSAEAPAQTQAQRTGTKGLTLRQADSPRCPDGWRNVVMVGQHRGQPNNPPDLFRRQLAVESLTQVLGKSVLVLRPALLGQDNHPLRGDRVKSPAQGSLVPWHPQIPPCLAPQVSPIVVACPGTLSGDGTPRVGGQEGTQEGTAGEQLGPRKKPWNFLFICPPPPCHPAGPPPFPPPPPRAPWRRRCG